MGCIRLLLTPHQFLILSRGLLGPTHKCYIKKKLCVGERLGRSRGCVRGVTALVVGYLILPQTTMAEAKGK